MEIAKTSNTPVLFTPAALPLEVEEPVKLAEEPVVASLKQAPVMAVKPTGEEVELAQVVTPPPIEMASNTLPKTASSLPLIGLLGLLALGGSWALRRLQKRV